MNLPMTGMTPDRIDLNKNWLWFLLWGLGLIIVGGAAIALSVTSTVVSVLLLGALFIVGGVITLVDTFHFWWKRSHGFYSHLIMGLLYLLLGIMCVVSPVVSAISLTMLLAIFFIVMGFFRIFFSVFMKIANWPWMLLSGIITLLLGILILAQLPISGLYIIGLFVGIDLFFWGWVYLMIAFFAKKSAQP